jgi:hypothetical protein
MYSMSVYSVRYSFETENSGSPILNRK